LSGLGAALLLRRANKRQGLSVGRPARTAVARAGGELPRTSAARRHDPQRTFVAIGFLIHPYADENYARTLRRDLGIRDPDELEQIHLGDPALLGAKRDRRQC